MRKNAETNPFSNNKYSFRSSIYHQKPSHLTSVSFQPLSFYIHKSNAFASTLILFAFLFHSPQKERRGKTSLKQLQTAINLTTFKG